MAKMTDADLRELVRKRRDASVKHLSDNHASDRREALRFYRGDDDEVAYGTRSEGLSTVVSRDTFEAVESILPGLIKPFVAGDEAVRFEPTQQEDEESAKQATEYINYLFANHNSAFRVTYDFAKDGLMFRLGVAKVVMEEVDESEIETLKGLDELSYMALDAVIREEKTSEILDDPVEEQDGSITVKIKRQKTRKTYRVHVLAPDEFLYEDRLANLEEATFLAHSRNNVSVGDLIAMGLDKRKCKELQGVSETTLEADDRHGWDEFRGQFDDDDLARKVSVTDAYVRTDYDGSGTLTWRRIIVGGGEDTVLLNEPVEDHPFVAWTPTPIPHKLVGHSVHDVVRDIQIQSTALNREALNALYLANRPMREYVEGQVNVEALLNPAVGGLVGVRQPGMISALPSGGEGVAQQSMMMIEHFATMREQRTGSTRYNQGMDANSLNKTATGISIIQNASTQRLEMISRQLAEAMMSVFKKMLGLVSRYADQAEVIRLRGEWVEMDPREWKNSYDMSVSVGLGTGNKEQMAAHITNLMGVQQQIAEAQGGLTGPIVKWDNIYESAKRLTDNLGLKGVERYFTDPAKQAEGGDQPAEAPTEQPEADPMQEAQMQAQLEIEKARIKAQADIEIARIMAEKDLMIAGMEPTEQAYDFGDYQPDGAAAPEGEEYDPQMPEYVSDEAPEAVPDDLGGDMA